jgi:anti-repressor protein
MSNAINHGSAVRYSARGFLLDMNNFTLIEIQNNLVDANGLYQFLQIQTRFNDWIARIIETYEFVEGEDFYSKKSKTNGRPRVDYLLTVDTAKEIAMVSNTENGKKARKYFIESEKKLKTLAVQALPSTYIEALEAHLQSEKEKALLLQQIEENRPKIEFHDKVAEAKGLLEMSAVGKIVGVGRTTLFRLLREKGLLRWNNEPYQEFIDRGYFEVKIQVFQDGLGGERINKKTLVTPKGVQYIDRIINNTKPLTVVLCD